MLLSRLNVLGVCVKEDGVIIQDVIMMLMLIHEQQKAIVECQMHCV